MSKFIIVNEAHDRTDEYLKEELDYLEITDYEEIKVYQVYEVDNLPQDIDKIFEDYRVVDDLKEFDKKDSFRYRLLPGMFDENEEMVKQLVRDFLRSDEDIHHSTIIKISEISDTDMDTFKDYFINDIENEIVPFEELDYTIGESDGEDLKVIDGFRDFSEEELEDFSQNYSMNLADFKLTREYFRSEDRDPSILELKVIDTYWSDHCRHTTFFTELKDISISEGKYKDAIEEALDTYMGVRDEVYTDKVRHRSLMDMGTINSRYMQKMGNLDDFDKSDEINAPAVFIDVDIEGGETEEWLLYFKNETHNHPTEIEPFGGAGTCVGGAIRDPLSGRSFVHQAMRVTGAKDPRHKYAETREGKLPQRSICLGAMEGSSDYGNKYGLPTGFSREYYDDGFEAKRMEVGANLAATPVENVVRITPADTDVIILIGGKTGRDGLGAAVGSSMVQTEDSLELQGSEVQKGNPVLERKIQRLFRNKDATTLIKMCNDFGAGGVSVAIGELADGIEIELDKVPVKYKGLDPAEIALAESQERMAVVVEKKDADKFIELAAKEDLDAVVVATVNNSGYMVMTHNGEEVLRLSREFLDSNGASREQDVIIRSESISDLLTDNRSITTQLGDLNNCSQKPIGQNFDFTVGKNTVLAPYGGKTRITEQLGMATKIPVLEGTTHTTSIMTIGYNPKLGHMSTYHGAFYAVLESIAKAVALGVPRSDIRLTLQEYFESLGTDKTKWGKPTGALLGAFTVMEYLDLAALGGKDSMSGTFEDLDVPPTLISFAVGVTDIDQIHSRELKSTESKILLIKPELNEYDLIDQQEMIDILDKIEDLIATEEVLSISTTENKTVENNLVEMALGNNIGFTMDRDYTGRIYPMGFLVEVPKDFDTEEIVVATTNSEEMVVIEEEYSLDELREIYTTPLESVYGKSNVVEVEELQEIDKEEFKSDAKVLIPVITGLFGEYDLYKSFKEYTDNVDFFVIKEELEFENSIKEFVTVLKDYDILALADGAVLGDHPQAGKAVELLLKEESIKPAIEEFIKTGQLLAIGSSAAAVINAGLIEHGEITGKTDIKVLSNPSNRYISEVVTAKVLDNSMSELEEYSTALGSYSLILDLDEQKYKDQIVSKFDTVLDGEYRVDGLKDKSGHILATIGNFERFDSEGMKNIDIAHSDYILQMLKRVK